VPTSGIMDINICTPINAFHPSMSSLSQSVGGIRKPAERKPEEDPAIPGREGNWGRSRREAHALSRLQRIGKGRSSHSYRSFESGNFVGTNRDPQDFKELNLGTIAGMNREQGAATLIKGTVSRDFLLLVFFMNQFPQSP
jgi:hypothetical protein